MNLDNDYDEDGNNIVHCPMYMTNYNPCKKGGRCPAEYSFVIEGEVRLLLDEFEATGDRSRIANVMEAVDSELEKVREGERVRIKALFPSLNPNSDSWGTTQMERILREIDSPTKTDNQTEV